MNTAAQIGKPIIRIVLTHAHNDHIGALDGLKSQLPDSKVYISERDAKLLKGDASLELEHPQEAIDHAIADAEKALRGSAGKGGRSHA